MNLTFSMIPFLGSHSGGKMCFAGGPEPVANAARLANAFTRNFLRSTIVVGLGNADVEMKPSRWLALN